MSRPLPTAQAYSELQRAYDHFNKELFDNKLPPCLITLQRRDIRVYGYFSPSRFGSNRTKGKTIDEIALNPIHFQGKNIAEVLQTLVHEMCHLWQFHLGKPSRPGYHNRQWADKMTVIGLYPSSTGAPGGKTTGQHMADFITKDGAFEKAMRSLRKNKFKVTWYDRIIELIIETQDATLPVKTPGKPAIGEKPKPVALATPTRRKFICPTCGLKAWAKPSAKLICGGCEVKLN